MRQRQRWRRVWNWFGQLTRSEQWCCIQGLAMLVCTSWGLRCVGFNRWFAGLQRVAAPVRAVPLAFDQAGQTWQLLRPMVQYGPYRGTCLSRSLTLWWLLRRQGIDTELRFGVRRKKGQLQAHAWLELEGRPLNANRRVHERYTAFAGAITPVQAEGLLE